MRMANRGALTNFIGGTMLCLLAICMLSIGQASAAEVAYIAHTGSTDSLAIANDDAENPRIVFTDSSSAYFGDTRLALSPDSRSVAYCINIQSGSNYINYIHVIDPNTKANLLATAEGNCSSLDFSPDGSRLLYGITSSDLDIWELTIDGSTSPRKLIGWNGHQMHAHYAPNGQHIIFTSNSDPSGRTFGETPPYQWHLYSTDADGQQPTNLTQNSSLWQIGGADYAVEPDIRLDSQSVVFECGYEGVGWSLCRINIDGTGALDMGLSGSSPHWTSDGLSIVYSSSGDIKSATPTGSNPAVLPLNFIEGKGYNLGRSVMRQSSSDVAGQARLFRPAIRLDEGERWRPLDVDHMVNELPPRICIRRKCQQLWGLADLATLSGSTPSTAVLDIPPVEGEWDTRPHVSDPDYYGSPDCSLPDAEPVPLIADCEDPVHSAIYYDSTHVSSGYQYLGYWFFYRFNDSPLDQIGGAVYDHEADWENIAVAISNSGGAETFDFALFEQHGSTYGYLPENLTCDEGGECGATSKQVDVYVSGGTHASYGDACSNTVPYCLQSNGVTPETDHGGELNWLNNGDVAALRKLPDTYNGPWTAGPGNFTDWPGMWGFDANFDSQVNSPANQDQFDPTGFEGTQLSLQSASPAGQSLNSSNTTSSYQEDDCATWFGAGVSSVLCSSKRLEDSLSRGAIGSRIGSADLVLRRRHQRGEQFAAKTGGLAQLAGTPLRPGDELEISGSIGAGGATLLVRAETEEVRAVATFFLPEGPVHARALIAKPLKPVVELASGERIQPSSVSVSEVPD